MYAYPYPYSAPVPSTRPPAEAAEARETSISGALNLSFLHWLRDDWRFGLAAGGALCVGLAAWGLGDSWRPTLRQADDSTTASAPLMSEAEAAQTTAPHFHIIANEAPPPPLPPERPARVVMDAQDADASADQPASAADACSGLAAPSARLLCSSRALADRDRRLRVAYGRALETSSDPDELQSEQARWMTLRDQAAAGDGEPAVAAMYDRRLQALDEAQDRN
jgi:uncharacterized protein YecT (DUF1311 family)